MTIRIHAQPDIYELPDGARIMLGGSDPAGEHPVIIEHGDQSDPGRWLLIELPDRERHWISESGRWRYAPVPTISRFTLELVRHPDGTWTPRDIVHKVIPANAPIAAIPFTVYDYGPDQPPILYSDRPTMIRAQEG